MNDSHLLYYVTKDGVEIRGIKSLAKYCGAKERRLSSRIFDFQDVHKLTRAEAVAVAVELELKHKGENSSQKRVSAMVKKVKKDGLNPKRQANREVMARAELMPKLWRIALGVRAASSCAMTPRQYLCINV